MPNLKRLLLSSLAVFLVGSAARAIDMTGGTYEMTKDVVGAAGPEAMPTMNSQDYSIASAAGEMAAGGAPSASTYQITSGYFGGQFGNSQTFMLLSSQIGQAGARTFFQDTLQVGVPFDAPIQLTFSDPLDATTISKGIQVVMAADHLGIATGLTFLSTTSVDALSQTVTVQPQTAWPGNTLLDVQATSLLQNIDGIPLSQTSHMYFMTMLDKHQDNTVITPLSAPNLPAAVMTGPVEAMSLQLPAESLSDYSAVLSSRDPLNTPLRVDPKIIQEANRKTESAGGPYRVPIALQEIGAYNASGAPLTTLSKPATLTIDYGGGLGAAAAGAGLVRPQTLSLYVLDQTHQLWVKIPASQNRSGFHIMSAPVTQLSVYALMGSADGSASDSYVFPNPWRPHGPKSGDFAGQTGTDGGGMTFTDLPSECTIKIYTLSGDLVRQIQHSDIGSPIGQGEEKWDGKTAHGDTAASGVYLWRVESSVDGKNGKLMIIR